MSTKRPVRVVTVIGNDELVPIDIVILRGGVPVRLEGYGLPIRGLPEGIDLVLIWNDGDQDRPFNVFERRTGRCVAPAPTAEEAVSAAIEIFCGDDRQQVLAGLAELPDATTYPVWSPGARH